MQAHYLSTSYARILFRHLRLSEATSDVFFSGTNVSYSQLMELDGHLSFEQQYRLFENALKITEQPGLGLSVGAQLHLSSHGVLGVAAFSSANLKVALQVFDRFSDVRAQFVQIGVSDNQQTCHIKIREALDLGDLRYFLTESVMSAVYSAIMFFTGAAPSFCELHFAYPEPEYGSLYSDFFCFPVYFDQPVTQVLIDHEALTLASPVADMALHKDALDHCEKLLHQLEKRHRSHEQQVRELLRNNPGKLWTIDEISSQLNMSKRTLMRKLGTEGHRFQTIRDDVVKQQAIAYLSDTRLTIESVGYLLGFSEVASFRRSFKRWFGQTPSNYLEQQRHARR